MLLLFYCKFWTQVGLCRHEALWLTLQIFLLLANLNLAFYKVCIWVNNHLVLLPFCVLFLCIHLNLLLNLLFQFFLLFLCKLFLILIAQLLVNQVLFVEIIISSSRKMGFVRLKEMRILSHVFIRKFSWLIWVFCGREDVHISKLFYQFFLFIIPH